MSQRPKPRAAAATGGRMERILSAGLAQQKADQAAARRAQVRSVGDMLEAQEASRKALESTEYVDKTNSKLEAAMVRVEDALAKEREARKAATAEVERLKKNIDESTKGNEALQKGIGLLKNKIEALEKELDNANQKLREATDQTAKNDPLLQEAQKLHKEVDEELQAKAAAEPKP